MSITDRIMGISLSPTVMLHATLLCNSLRLAADPIELVEAVAQAKGFIAGLRVGDTINDSQHEQLQALFGELAQRAASAV